MKQIVLLTGYRAQIAQRLTARGIPFIVWHDKTIKCPVSGCLRIIDRVPFSESISDNERTLAKLFPSGQFTHVIAGTEASVIAASVARHWFCARTTDHDTVRRCHDKRMMKSFLRHHGVPLVPYLDPAEKSFSAEEVIPRLGLPVVAKPIHLSGRQGLRFLNSPSDLQNQYYHALTEFDAQSSVLQAYEAIDSRSSPTKPLQFPPILFEKYLDALEVSIESWIRNGEIQFTNISEYVDKTWVNLVPARLHGQVRHELLKLNQQVVRSLGIEWGLAHAEYFIANDQIYFGEIALRPPGGYLMNLISLAYGFDAWDAFVDNELDLPFLNQPSEEKSAASVLFHPGSGKLLEVQGVEAIRNDPNLHELTFLRRPGQRIPERTRVGIAAAYAIFSASSANEVLASLDSARQSLKFVLESSAE
jgi:formate-dependent phosphoribosylglycinamide formyltransferase (GAR transformylase)